MCKVLTGNEQKIIKDYKANNPHICYYCNEPIKNPDDLTVDHLQPRCRGGKTEIKNLRICCHKCNQEKGDMTEQEYRLFKSNIHKNNLPINVDLVVGEIINTIEIYNSLETQLKQKEEQINAIQNVIASIQKVGTVGGYKYFEMLQKLLIEKETIETQRKSLQPLYNFAMNQKNALRNVKDNVNKNVKKHEKQKVMSLTGATEVLKKVEGFENLRLNIV